MSTRSPILVRSLGGEDANWVKQFIAQHWGSDEMVIHGQVYRISEQLGFVAVDHGTVLGLVSYRFEGDECEITSLDSLQPAVGIGSALVEAVKDAAKKAGCQRLYLTTTNDNLHAFGWYQRRGFTLAGIRLNAVAESRKIKPQIPLIGDNGIPIRDEIELEMLL